jgi:predicted XRE-type DNA-binding protein
MSKRTATAARTGNLFAEFGFPYVEAQNLLLRSRLMSEAREVARGLTKAQAAKQLGVAQSRLNDLLRGEIDEFSVDALINMLSEAGMQVQLRVKRRRSTP